jgi:hypothetical protein
LVAPAHRHTHKFIWFRRLSPYEVLNVVFSVLGLLSLYFLLEQTRGTFVQAQHLARSVESGAYQSITTELLELHKLHLEHPELRPYFRGGRDIRPDDPNYEQALVLAEYQKFLVRPVNDGVVIATLLGEPACRAKNRILESEPSGSVRGEGKNAWNADARSSYRSVSSSQWKWWRNRCTIGASNRPATSRNTSPAYSA